MNERFAVRPQVERGRRLVGRAARRLGDRLASVDAPPASERVAPTTQRPRPTPAGWTEEELRAVMSTFAIDDAGLGELCAYLDDAFWRFLHTWGLARCEQGRALELGANPYFTTWLLREFTDLDLTLANYFGGDRGRLVQKLRYIAPDGSPREHSLESDLFNMEEDTFPYGDRSFDVVCFCEILEHLLMNPLHSLNEIHRVLRPDGLLVLTTPNVARLGNVLALVAGENLYDPYSGYGPYGRHNREYTQHELVRLLTFAGFDVHAAFTADAHPEPYESRFAYADVAPTVAFRAPDLGQYLFVAARATRAPRNGLPAWLFRSWPPEQLVEQL